MPEISKNKPKIFDRRRDRMDQKRVLGKNRESLTRDEANEASSPSDLKWDSELDLNPRRSEPRIRKKHETSTCIKVVCGKVQAVNEKRRDGSVGRRETFLEAARNED